MIVANEAGIAPLPDEAKTIHKLQMRLIPFLFLLYVVAFVDRINIGFAALTMNKELGITSQQYGMAAGIFFIGYFLFEVPSNLMLHKVGARVWIARILLSWGLVATLMPDQPEVLGLLALMKLNVPRSAARFDAAGDMVLLPDQDRSLWDQAAIAEGVAILERAGAMRSTGPYQIQAAIAALHSGARFWEETDWPQIVLLYDALLRMGDSPVVRLNRAVALSHVAGPEVALGEVNDLALVLSGYHLYHSTRGELLEQIGEPVLAREARRRALDLCQNPAERSLLERKLRG